MIKKEKLFFLLAGVPLFVLVVYGVAGESKSRSLRRPSHVTKATAFTVSEALEQEPQLEAQPASPDQLMESQPAPQVNLLTELQNVSQLKGLVEDESVRALWNRGPRQTLAWLASAPAKEKRQAFEASQKVVNVLSSCLSDPRACGLDTSEWESYFSVGGAPVHQALEQGLEIYKSLYELGELNPRVLDRQSLMQAQKVAHHNISVMATDLLLSAVETPNEFAAVLESSESLRGEARAFFYEIAGPMVQQRGWGTSQQGVVDSLLRSMGHSDNWTKQQVAGHLDQMGLSQDQFEAVAKKACPARPKDRVEDVAGRVIQDLQAQARRQGFATDILTLCFGAVTRADAI